MMTLLGSGNIHLLGFGSLKHLDTKVMGEDIPGILILDSNLIVYFQDLSRKVSHSLG